jgi:undecaprenyl-diphosphatase
LHEQRTNTRQILLAVSVAFLIAFGLVTFFRPSFQTIDLQVNLWTPTIRTPTLTTLAQGVSLAFETNSLVLISIVISGLLFLKNRKQWGLLLFAAMGGDALLVTIIKTIEHIARPTNGLYTALGFSYPSGHSVAVVVFVGTLAYLTLKRCHNIPVKAAIGAGFGGLVAVVGFDRIYLNVHWFSDVLGGWLFGAFWITFVIAVFVWLESAGKFCSARFNVVANWLYVVAFVVSILVVVSGSIV